MEIKDLEKYKRIGYRLVGSSRFAKNDPESIIIRMDLALNSDEKSWLFKMLTDGDNVMYRFGSNSLSILNDSGSFTFSICSRDNKFNLSFFAVDSYLGRIIYCDDVNRNDWINCLNYIHDYIH